MHAGQRSDLPDTIIQRNAIKKVLAVGVTTITPVKSSKIVLESMHGVTMKLRMFSWSAHPGIKLEGRLQGQPIGELEFNIYNVSAANGIKPQVSVSSTHPRSSFGATNEFMVDKEKDATCAAVDQYQGLRESWPMPKLDHCAMLEIHVGQARIYMQEVESAHQDKLHAIRDALLTNHDKTIQIFFQNDLASGQHGEASLRWTAVRMIHAQKCLGEGRLF